MSEPERVKISSFIEKEIGIKMPEAKKALLTGRLAKRLKASGTKSFGEYFEFIQSAEGKREYLHFIDLVSTHETSFFREPAHYEFLIHNALPALMRDGSGVQRDLRILSAACSSGEEIYSAACAVEEFIRINKIQNFRYTLTGTDISSHVIIKAARGVYPSHFLQKIPAYAHRFFMHSRDSESELIRVVPEIREKVRFMQVNLLDQYYPFEQKFDIVFCRNVMIYFDRETQLKVASKLCNAIADNGYLLVGHSESLMGFPLPIEGVAPAAYIVRPKN